MGLRPILSNKRRKHSQSAAIHARKQSLRRKLLLETLEARQMMAVGPQLQAIIPNEGPHIFLNQPLHSSPTELKLVFTEGQTLNPNTLGSIFVLRSGGDGVFGNGNDVLITPFDPGNPGHVGLGDHGNEVVIRFPSALPDDHYAVTVVGDGASPLRSTTGDPYNDGVTTTYGFEIELGTRIVGVVPQPITNTGGQLSQARDVIEVYFDRHDPIDPNSAQDPSFYQLLATNDTATTADDASFQPTSVIFEPTTGRATLSFGADLASLAGTGTYRLRVGNNDLAPHAGNPETPILITPASDNDSQYLTANQLGALGTSSLVISGAIDPQDYGLALPGGNNEPGHRNIPAESHLLLGADNVDGISTIYYNFQNVIGVDLQGNTLFNVITPTQKQRVREVFEFYGNYLGAQFVETDNQGWLIATGDLHAVDPSINSGPGGVLGVAGGGKVVVDAAENFGNSEFGGLFFQVAMHEIGHLIGIGHSTDLPDLTINSGTIPGQFGNTGELVFPGDQDIVHGRHLFRPESKDIDLYQFTLDQPGTLSAEIMAERLADSSLLDAVVTLFDESHSFRVPGGAGNTADVLDGATFGIADGVNLPIGLEFNLAGTAPSTSMGLIPYNLGDSAEVMAQRIADAINEIQTKYGVPFTGRAVVSGDRVKVTNIVLMGPNSPRLEYIPNYREVIARNDDYFSEDSFLNMELAPGRYYIGVTSKGNTSYNPTIADSGFGGTTQGAYQLRLNFNPNPTAQMVDTSGTPLDGDSDGHAGGEFNYWFTVADAANTVIVDKSALPGGTGDISAPLNNLQTALAVVASLPATDKVLRLVGNGGADNNLATVGDAVPYTIGFDTFGNPLADGATFDVPKNVTVMVDGGAVFKMRSANIDVGSSAQNIDRSLGALQVLGTPLNKVYFTSSKDEVIGADLTPGQPTIPSPGDWGGLVFRNDLDYATGHAVRETEGIFLNYVNQAEIRYGGGDVVVDSLQQTFTPVHMVRSRPTVTNNTIAGSADAAMSADPNSFEESHFFNNESGTEYTADYERVGPEIHFNQLSTLHLGRVQDITNVSSSGPIVITTALPHGLTTGARVRIAGVLGNTAANGNFNITVTGSNSFTLNGATSNGAYTPSAGDTWQTLETLDNSINGLFVRIRTQSGSPIDKLDVSARFDDTDIVHVISQALVISGTPGGPRLDAGSGDLKARLDARLAIDPGTIVKLDGARIETQIGTQLIAEGTAANPIVFTSITDDRYGRGGTFDTNADEASVGVLGDWGGLFFNRLSTGSLDHVLVTYGGGQSTIEGGIGAFFNAIEIHQADVRIANSMLRENEGIAASGTEINRNDRGTNEAATIFVRGAQPILVNNIIRDNAGDAITINANALNSTYISDIGRSVGAIDVIPLEHANQGPLVRGNRMRNNNTNGMVVRGAVLTTESVWDDTDIVHVLLDEMEVPNHHTFGGLRLKSNPGESLVVKLQGGSAGFTAGGTKLDISDRIGGTLQVVGMPEFPVIMTALTDDSAAAGVDIDGAPAGDTNEGFRALGATSGQTNASYDGLDIIKPVTNPNAFSVPTSKWGNPRFGTGAVVTWAFMPAGVVDSGNLDGGWTNTPLSAFMPTGFENEIRRAFAAWSSVSNITFVEITDTGEPFGQTGAADIRVGGHAIDGLGGVLGHGYLPANNPAAPFDGDLHFDLADAWKIGFGGNPNAVDIFQVAAHEIGHAIGLGHTTVPGSLMEPFYTEAFAGPQADDIAGAVFLYGQPAIGSAGAWRSVRLEKFANDRNVEVVIEAESSTAGIDTNNLAATAQYIGELAVGEKHSDENLRLGFEVHGFVSLNNTTDVDVYSFTAQTNTEVWFDIDRTTHALDTVIELIDAQGNVLARSDNSVAELETGMLPAIPGTNLARLMQRDAFNGDDLYTTNPRDAGMRVLLPGAAGQRNTYFVRVRSRGLTADTSSPGLTNGGYQLQIRLREADEVPGTTIRNSNIRFAVNGIEALGLPAHSPLLGDAQETTGNNDSLANAQDLGNLLSNDRGSISVGGNLDSPADVDFFRITVDYDLIQSLTGVRSWAAMFDIDYADGLGRPDTVISVFDAAGNLLLVGRDSDIAEDQPGPTQGADTDDLNRGTFGKLDPYIGTVQIPEQGISTTGVNAPRTYIVAVSSNARLPSILNATFASGANNPLIRLEPVTSVRRVLEDHIGFTGGGTGVSAGAAFSGTTTTELNLHANAFQLGDVTMFVNSSLQLFTVDAFTGASETNVTFQNGANDQLPATNQNRGYRDIAMRNDGRLYAFTLGSDNATSGNFVEINPADGTQISRGDDGIVTIGLNNQGQPAASDVGIQFEAVDFFEPNGRFNRELYAIGWLPAAPEHARRNNLLYEFNPDTGAALADNFNTTPAQIPPSEPLPRATLDVGTNGVKLTVVAGIQIDDGDSFQVDEGFGPVTLEMDSGVTLMVNSPASAIPDGTTFSVSDGSTTVTYMFDKDPSTPPPANVVVVSINDTMNASAVAAAIASVLTAGQITTQPNQPLLPNPHAGNLRATHLAPFGQGTRVHIEDLNIATVYGASSGSAHVSVLGAADVQTPGAFRIAFTPMDTANVVAQRIERALLTNSPLSTITAISVGNMVNLQVSPQAQVPVVTIPASTPFTQAALPGGFGGVITGMQFLGNSMYAVTDTGTFLEYSLGNVLGNVSFNPLVTPIFSTNINQIPFRSLTLAPQGIDADRDGTPDYQNMFIATAADGRMYALNTLGQLQPIFVDGATSVFTGGPGGGAHGIAFSPIDYNLWHVTNRRQFDDGHDITTSFDRSRSNLTPGSADGPDSRTFIEGGTSFYFGLEDPNVNTTISNQPGADNFRTNTNFSYDTYNLPGGAHGSLTTDAFSLEGYSSTDKPTLYFDYFLETENTNLAVNQAMRDSFRVFISNDGVNWSQLATNNSTLSFPSSQLTSELPDHLSTSGGTYRGDLAKQRVQELFDNTDGWRQARVDLGDFAGMSNLRMRFDFSTAASMNLGGVSGGVALSGRPGSELRDGQTFTIGHSNFALPPITFEFDSGYTLVMPTSAGSSIAEGDTFIIDDGANPPVTYEFDRDGIVSGTNIAILISNTDSAADVAAKVQSVLVANPPGVATSILNGIRINLQGAVNVAVGSATVTLDGAPGVTMGNTAIVINEGMTLDEVVRQMGLAIDAAFAAQAGNADDPTVQTTAQFDKGAVRLYGKNVLNAGPLTSSNSLIGDNLGSFFSSNRGKNNNFEGALIDNIIVGFAERGEMVTGQSVSGQQPVANATFFATPADPTPSGLQNLSGAYQLEIRRGTEYGTLISDLTGDIFLSRTLDTNDRLSDEFTLRLPAGSALRDGQTVTINDGLNVVVFEFDDNGVFNPQNVPVSFTALQSGTTVAATLAAAINNNATLSTLAGTTPTSNRVDLTSAAFVDITFGGVSNTGDLSLEPNDVIANAIPSGLSSATPGTFRASGLIGDNPNLLIQPSRDVDMVSFQLDAGQTIRINVDAREFGSALDSVIRVFDATGIEVAFNDDDFSGQFGHPLDSYLEFTALVSGTYFAAISGFSNLFYNPHVEGSGFLAPNTTFTSGAYSIEMTIGDNLIRVEQYDLVGDDNQYREQGQIIIQGNEISRFSQNGILVDSDLRDVPGQLPHQGSVRNLTQLNTARLVAGVTITNNVIHNIGQTGILISGEANTAVGGQPVSPGAVPFVRVVNNTIWGGAARPGTGIAVTENASPTLLNNIVADVGIGVSIDASSQAAGTVLSATLYRNAPTTSANTGAINGGLGSFPIVLTNADALFENELAGVFSLRKGSRAIDSSIDSVEDRPQLITVKNPLGIGLSPILAPARDLMGVLRQDDPSQSPPLGQGGNPFKDRGALERVNVPRISIAGNSVIEGDQGTANLVFTVSLDQVINDLVTIDYATSNQNAAGGVDYVNTSGKLTFLPGSSTVQTITVPVIGDRLDENDETFLITLSNETNALILVGQATGTIIDDDIAPTVSINNATVTEGNNLTTPMVFTVSLDGPSGRTLTIDFATSDLTANGGLDYQATSGVLTFAPGQTSRTLTINVFGDVVSEQDETFNITLSNPVNVQLPVGTVGVGTIIDDEPRFTIADATLVEGNSGTQNMVFNVSLLPAVGTTVTVSFATQDGTATASSDYQATSGTLTFAPNETMKTITVRVNGDTTDEPDENFVVVLSSPQGAGLGDATATGTIVNDDSSGPGGPGSSLSLLITAADAGGGPHVRVFDASTFQEKFGFFAYSTSFSGGVRVATADMNGDGVDDIITAPGAGGGPHVRMFDGATGAQLNTPISNFFAFEGSYTGGVHIAAGDVNGDGRADLIAATGSNGNVVGEGSSTRVRVFNGVTGGIIREFFFSSSSPFSKGMHVAAGDITGDNRDEIIVSSVAGNVSRVQVYDALSGALMRDFSPYGAFAGGVYAAAGDLNGDNRDEIITGAGSGGGPHVMAFDGATNAVLHSFFAYAPAMSGGVRVATTDANLDGRADIITAPGFGFAPHVRVFNGVTGAIVSEAYAYSPAFGGGVYLAGNGGGSPLMANGLMSATPATVLTDAQLRPIVEEAIVRWAGANISAEQLGHMRNTSVRISDLPAGYLGVARDEGIFIDADAAGYGWYVDEVPADDSEFASPAGEAATRMDLLTAVMHELGHAAGLDHAGDARINDLMAETLVPGLRRSPTDAHIDDVFGSDDQWLY
jgi:hypothetical protein